MKTEVMSIKEFMNRKPVPLRDRVVRHIEKYGVVYKVVGMTVIILSTGSIAFADSGIDQEARKLYKELIGIGKWIIVFKGGFDLTKTIIDGDLPAAKKSFFGYLLTYLLLLGLPYGLDKINDIFNHVSTPTSAGGM